MLNALQNSKLFLNIPDIVYQKTLKSLVTFLIGLILILIIKKSLRFFFNSIENKSRLSSYKKRIDTFSSLFENIATVLIFLIVGLMIARDLGFDITPILTGAGILGLALSFGAQSLVKDLISGFFLISENQYNIGDIIKVDTEEGAVLKLNLRTTVLRDKKGNTVYIPNSSITKVTVIERKVKILIS